VQYELRALMQASYVLARACDEHDVLQSENAYGLRDEHDELICLQMLYPL